MEERYQETAKTWNKIAELYADKFMELDIYDDSCRQFCSRLPNEASVIELGCGPGNVTRRLLAYHQTLSVHATDISTNMLEIAQRINPNITTEVLDARNLGAIKQSFNGVVCGFLLPYLSKEDLACLVKNANQVLLPEGLLYFSFVPGDYDKSGYQRGSGGDRTYFYFHEEDYIENLFSHYELEIVWNQKLVYHRSSQESEMHFIMIAKKTNKSMAI